MNRPDALERLFPPPVPSLPRKFDWNITYAELHVQLEKARTKGDRYAFRAAEQAISNVDGTLMSACSMYCPESQRATPDAMYQALRCRRSLFISNPGSAQPGASRKLCVALRNSERITHQKVVELCLREREFSAVSPAAVSLYGTTARGESAAAGGVAQSAVAFPVPAFGAGEGFERLSCGLTGSSHLEYKPAAPDFPTAVEAWPTRFGSLKQDRDVHLNTGNTAVARVYDAAIEIIVRRLRHALRTLDCVASVADTLEPEAAFASLAELRYRQNLRNWDHFEQRSVTMQLQGVIQLTCATQAHFAGRAREFAALSPAAPRPSRPAMVSDPQALESWLRLEVIIAQADKATPPTGIHNPAPPPPSFKQGYFERVLKEHAGGGDAWSASIAFLRELLIAGHLDEAQVLQTSHRRLLRAMADPSLKQIGEAIRFTLPAPCCAYATGPESPGLSSAPSQALPVASPFKIIRQEVNPWFTRIDSEPTLGWLDELGEGGSTDPGPMLGAQWPATPP